MKQEDSTKLRRLYVDGDLCVDGIIEIEGDSHHYLRNVMRLDQGSQFRVFNGYDGEWIATISEQSKKRTFAHIGQQLKKQSCRKNEIHLFFAPLKKQRLDALIEKAVELGATHLHPFTSAYADVRKINEDRLRAQIIEASEQCERDDIPKLFSIQSLENMLANIDGALNIYAALERADVQSIHDVRIKGDVAFIIGPVGGFADHEKDQLKAQKNITPISLGERVLRSETAVLFCLSHVKP